MGVASGQTTEETADRIKALLLAACQHYTERNPQSQQWHEAASSNLPGGNTRSVLHTDPFPICMKRGYGNRLVDYDGHEYLDLVGDMTAGVYGHSHPLIRDAVISTTNEIGFNLGAATAGEARLAALICQRIESIELLRFCNSGTEANLYALILARIVTGRSKVIAFKGGYHGGVLSFGDGVGPNVVDRADWILGTYNDVEGVRRLIMESKDEAAAVLVEPMQGSAGCIPGSASFLHEIQETARENGVIFILDEVMTSRLAPGSLQSVILHPHKMTPLSPDLTTLGKYIAGGMTIGAFGGRRDLLSVYDPRNSKAVSHSGTFNNNTLAMNVGYAALSSVYTPEACIALNSMGDNFRENLRLLARGTMLQVTGVGAVCNIHFVKLQPGTHALSSVDSLEMAPDSIEALLKDLLWFYLIERGYWIARRGMISLILGTTEEELQEFLDVVRGFLKEHEEIVRI